MKKTGYILISILLFSCNNETLNTSVLLTDAISSTKYYQTEIFTDSNLKLYGRWQFLNVFQYASVTGGTGKTNPSYDYLEFKKYGIYGKVKDNKLIETGKIEIITQDNSQFEIKLKPDDKDSINSNLYFVTYSNDSIVMRDASVFCGVLLNNYKRKN